jgi:nitroreductase
MDFKKIVTKNRSCRRFHEDRRIGAETLRGWVDLARQTPSGRNMQPLKYRLVHDPEECAALFPLTAWAGYLTEWPGPEEGERPAAYIVTCNDTALAGESRWDQGIAAQTILLAATEAGYGGCIIGAFRKPELVELLSLPENLVPVLVLALGVPKETVVLTEVGPDGDIKYYRDEAGTHYVPKRALEEVIIR